MKRFFFLFYFVLLKAKTGVGKTTLLKHSFLGELFLLKEKADGFVFTKLFVTKDGICNVILSHDFLWGPINFLPHSLCSSPPAVSHMDVAILWWALSPAADWSICALIGGDGEADNPSPLKGTVREDEGPAFFCLSYRKRTSPKRMILQITHVLSESQIYTLLSKDTLSEKKGFAWALRFIPDILNLSRSLRMSYWLKSEMWSAWERLIYGEWSNALLEVLVWSARVYFASQVRDWWTLFSKWIHLCFPFKKKKLNILQILFF